MQRFIIITCLAVFFLFASSITKAGEKITISVEVKHTQPNGKSWDPMGGLPDIQIKIYNTQIGVIVSPRVENTLKTSYTFDIPDDIEDEINLEIWDRDGIQHDLIGGCSFEVGGKQEFECGSAKVKVKN